MRTRLGTLFLAAVVAIAACSSGSSTGPSANVTGQWALSGTFANATDTIFVTATMMSLTQSGSTFSGGYSGGTFTCSAAGSRYDCTPSNGQIINGQTSGSSVTFAVDTTAQPFQGTLNGSTMSGTGSIIGRTGSWTAAKQ